MAIVPCMLLAFSLSGCGPQRPEAYGVFVMQDAGWTKLSTGEAVAQVPPLVDLLVHSRELSASADPAESIKLFPVFLVNREVEKVMQGEDKGVLSLNVKETELTLIRAQHPVSTGAFLPVRNEPEMVEIKFSQPLMAGVYELVAFKGNYKVVVGFPSLGDVPSESYLDKWFVTVMDDTPALGLALARLGSPEGFYNERKITSTHLMKKSGLQDEVVKLSREMSEFTNDSLDSAGLLAILKRSEEHARKFGLDNSNAKAKIGESFGRLASLAEKAYNYDEVLRLAETAEKNAVGSDAVRALRQSVQDKMKQLTSQAIARVERQKATTRKMLESRNDPGEKLGEYKPFSVNQSTAVWLRDTGAPTGLVITSTGVSAHDKSNHANEKVWFGDFHSCKKDSMPFRDDNGEFIQYRIIIQPKENFGSARPMAIAFRSSEVLDEVFNKIISAWTAWRRSHLDALDTTVAVGPTYLGSDVWMGGKEFHFDMALGHPENFIPFSVLVDHKHESLVSSPKKDHNLQVEEVLQFKTSGEAQTSVTIHRLIPELWSQEDEASYKTEAANHRRRINAVP